MDKANKQVRIMTKVPTKAKVITTRLFVLLLIINIIYWISIPSINNILYSSIAALLLTASLVILVVVFYVVSEKITKDLLVVNKEFIKEAKEKHNKVLEKYKITSENVISTEEGIDIAYNDNVIIFLRSFKYKEKGFNRPYDKHYYNIYNGISGDIANYEEIVIKRKDIIHYSITKESNHELYISNDNNSLTKSLIGGAVAAWSKKVGPKMKKNSETMNIIGRLTVIKYNLNGKVNTLYLGFDVCEVLDILIPGKHISKL